MKRIIELEPLKDYGNFATNYKNDIMIAPYCYDIGIFDGHGFNATTETSFKKMSEAMNYIIENELIAIGCMVFEDSEDLNGGSLYIKCIKKGDNYDNKIL